MPANNITLSAKMRQASMLLGQGHTAREVADVVGKPEDTILAWKRRPDFQALCMEECNKWLLDLRPQALMLLKTMLEADDKKLGYNAANFILRYASQQETIGPAQIVVNFTGGMPEPGLPKCEATQDESDQDEFWKNGGGDD